LRRITISGKLTFSKASGDEIKLYEDVRSPQLIWDFLTFSFKREDYCIPNIITILPSKEKILRGFRLRLKKYY